jgi:hypothetical protein
MIQVALRVYEEAAGDHDARLVAVMYALKRAHEMNFHFERQADGGALFVRRWPFGVAIPLCELPAPASGPFGNSHAS